MPIYEYQCKKCGEFEFTQRITDAPLSKCPTCRGKVTKLISTTSFQLKGSGWYITDYGRSGGPAKPGGAETKSEGKSEAKAESKSEGKSSDTKADSGKSSDSKPASKKSPAAQAAAA